MMFKLALLLSGVQLCFAEIANIVRPCDFNDYICIGDNLAANSKCKSKRNGFLAPKYVVDTFHFDTPYFNASYIDVNLIIRNQNKCRVSEFFFNTETDRVVLAIDCPFLDLESDRTFIQHKTYQESRYYYYHIRGVYPLIRFTINLPSVTRMDLCSAHIYTDVVELPKLHIDPKNEPTANYLTRDLTLLNIYERENCHARGRPLTYMFIDSLICDYGCAIPK